MLRHCVVAVAVISAQASAEASFEESEAPMIKTAVWARLQALPPILETDTDGVITSEARFELLARFENYKTLQACSYITTEQDGRLEVNSIVRATHDHRYCIAICRRVD